MTSMTCTWHAVAAHMCVTTYATRQSSQGKRHQGGRARASLSALSMADSVRRLVRCFSSLSAGTSSMRFLECTQNMLRPMEKGLQSGSVTTRSPAT